MGRSLVPYYKPLHRSQKKIDIRQRISEYSSFNLAEKHFFHTVVQVYKVLHHLCPGYLFILLKYSQYIIYEMSIQAVVYIIYSSIGKICYCGVIILSPNLCGLACLPNFKTSCIVSIIKSL